MIGVVLGDTAASERIALLISPVRDMFSALFFLSIGMLIDYRTLDDYILPALVVVAVFMTGKIVANYVGSILAGRSPADSLKVSLTMPQMGEFSLGHRPPESRGRGGKRGAGADSLHMHGHNRGRWPLLPAEPPRLCRRGPTGAFLHSCGR